MPSRDAAYEYALLHPATMNEVARYDTPEEAHNAAEYSRTQLRTNVIVRQVKAGSGEVCLGIEDDRG